MTEFQPIQFGKYTLLDKIAVGGMAELYRGKLTGAQGFEKLIAIKRILPHLATEEELVQSFIEEAKLAAFLHHKNIIHIYDFGTSEGTYFIAMEYLFGKDLQMTATKARLKHSPLSLENALYISSQICSGLDYAHNLNDFQGEPIHIIHRDMSPQNVFLSYEGEVKIVDFGIAKAAGQNTMTPAGKIKGKVSYMSPEQAEGKEIDHRSDIFSTGILLYEMVTGIRMFEGSTFEALSKVRKAKFTKPEELVKDLPSKLYKIMQKALKKDPKQRYQSCGEMLADIEEVMYQLPSRPTASSLSQYMKELFSEEIVAEQTTMREVTKIHMVSEPLQEEKTKVLNSRENSVVRRKKELWLAALAMAVMLTGSGVVVMWTQKPASKSTNPVAATPEKVESIKMKAGLESLKSERFADAVRLFDELLSHDPSLKEKISLPYAQALQGQASRISKTDPVKAKGLLLRAIELDPQSVQRHFQLGLIYVKLEDYSKAIRTYEKAALLDPTFPDTFFNLGYVYAVTHQYVQAEQMYMRVVELAPPFLDEALFNLAIVQKKLGKREKCLKNLEQAVKTNPKNEQARKYLQQWEAS